MLSKYKVSYLIGIIALLSLAACGGSSPAPPTNQPPTANAGIDQTVDEQATVTLSGSGADIDGTVAGFSWTQVSGTSVTLIDSDTATASFTGADISADETLTFRLSVTDDDGASASDDIDIFRINQITLSGSYQVVPLTQVDSDINDPGAVANIDNGTALTAQSLLNFSTVHGFASLSGTGRIAELDRFASSADEFDSYRVVLRANQTLRLQVVDFVLRDVFTGDLDLLLFDTATVTLVAFSDSITEFENLVVPSDGEYFIVVRAFSGSSKYTLALDGVAVLNAVTPNSMDFMPGEAVVQFKPGSSINSFNAGNPSINLSHRDTSRATRANFKVNANSPLISGKLQQSDFEQALAQSNPDSYRKYKTLQQIKRLNLRQDVEFAEPNYILHPLRVPDDNFYNLQWHYPAINLPQAWDITIGGRTGSDVIVAVVDTGVFLAHPEFAGQLVAGFDFIADPQRSADGDNIIDADPDDPGDASQLGSSSWHGTHVSGTVAALSDNTSGVAGVAWEAKIMPVRVLGVGGGTGFDVIQGVRFAAGLSNDSLTFPAQKADIINLSLGGGGFSQLDQDTYNEVRAAGVIVVAAAGNENSSQLSFPASYDGVVSVSATDFANNRAPYSNFGSRVDVAAPGGNTGVDLNNDTFGDGVLSTLVDDSSGTRNATFAFFQGTSMATPHMAGVVALMRAVHPALSPDDLDNLLSSGAITTDLGVAGRDDDFGHGLIDALKAVQQAQLLANGGTAPPLPAAIVATPNQLTFGPLDGSSASLVLSNEGELSDPVIGPPVTDLSWLTISAGTVDADGLGDYLVEIDRTGLGNSTYQGSITFNLTSLNSLIVQVSIQVGAIDNTGDVGHIFMRLLDTNFNLVDQVAATDQGNGLFNYSFSNVAAGAYFIVGGSDIDNDSVICQLAEACGGYPTFDALSIIDATDVDINGLDFVIDILSNFGAPSSSVNGSLNPGGFQRHSIDGKLFKQ